MAGGIPASPVIAVDSLGYVHLAAWVKDPATYRWDIALRTRPPGGAFGPPVRISNESRLVVFDSHPRLVVTSDDALIVAWPGAGEARVRWSFDRGGTFSPVVKINQDIAARELDLAIGPAGAIHVTIYGQRNGQDDLFYSRTPNPLALSTRGRKFRGIDPDEFLPMVALTNDAQTNPLYNLAVDSEDRPYIAWSDPGVFCHSLTVDVVAGQESGRIAFPCFAEGQVASAPKGGIAIVFTQKVNLNRFDPYLMFASRTGVTVPRPIPATGSISYPGDARSIHHGGNGFVALLLGETDANGWDYWIEARVTRDYGLTFSPPFRASLPPTPDLFRTVSDDPALAVDSTQTLHIAYVNLDRSCIMYCNARYD